MYFVWLFRNQTILFEFSQSVSQLDPLSIFCGGGGGGLCGREEKERKNSLGDPHNNLRE